MMQFLVIGWLALEITGSSAKFGLVISLYGGRNVAFLLVAGIIADRFNRRHILIITQVSAGIIIAVLTCLYLADFVVFWHDLGGMHARAWVHACTARHGLLIQNVCWPTRAYV